MLETWQWLLYVNIPCMILNLVGMWFATGIRITPKTPRLGRVCFWVNVGAFALSIGNILSNSLILVCRYGDGTG